MKIMAYKRTFEQVYREFAAEHPDVVDTLTMEQLAERTGYSVSAVRDHFRVQESIRSQKKAREEEEQIRALEAGAVTFVTSSGSARVMYYPLLGETRMYSSNLRKREYPSTSSWGQREVPSLLFSPQDTIEIGIYLLGLQPHTRDVLTRKEQVSPFAAALTDIPVINDDDE